MERLRRRPVGLWRQPAVARFVSELALERRRPGSGQLVHLQHLAVQQHGTVCRGLQRLERRLRQPAAVCHRSAARGGSGDCRRGFFGDAARNSGFRDSVRPTARRLLPGLPGRGGHLVPGHRARTRRPATSARPGPGPVSSTARWATRRRTSPAGSPAAAATRTTRAVRSSGPRPPARTRHPATSEQPGPGQVSWAESCATPPLTLSAASPAAAATRTTRAGRSSGPRPPAPTRHPATSAPPGPGPVSWAESCATPPLTLSAASPAGAATRTTRAGRSSGPPPPGPPTTGPTRAAWAKTGLPRRPPRLPDKRRDLRPAAVAAATRTTRAGPSSGPRPPAPTHLRRRTNSLGPDRLPRRPLAYPTSDVICGQPGGGCYQDYQGGAIIWSPATGAHPPPDRPVRPGPGPLPRRPARLPDQRHYLRPAHGGCYQDYQGGAIIWSPATGAQPSTKGPIRDFWARSGFLTGPLGYPTAPQTCTPAGDLCTQTIHRRKNHMDPRPRRIPRINPHRDNQPRPNTPPLQPNHGRPS